MSSLFDSFWRAAAYCLIPRVIFLSLLPLVLIAVISGIGGYFFWHSAVAATEQFLGNATWLGSLWTWLSGMGWDNASGTLAPLLVVLAAIPVIVLIALLLVAVLMTPALVNLVAARRFPLLVRKKGARWWPAWSGPPSRRWPLCWLSSSRPRCGWFRRSSWCCLR